jgi:hypothetical protein
MWTLILSGPSTALVPLHYIHNFSLPLHSLTFTQQQSYSFYPTYCGPVIILEVRDVTRDEVVRILILHLL